MIFHSMRELVRLWLILRRMNVLSRLRKAFPYILQVLRKAMLTEISILPGRLSSNMFRMHYRPR